MALSQCTWNFYLRIACWICLAITICDIDWVRCLPTSTTVEVNTLDPIGEDFRRYISNSLSNDTQKVYIDTLSLEEVEHHRHSGRLPLRTIERITKLFNSQMDNPKIPFKQNAKESVPNDQFESVYEYSESAEQIRKRRRIR